MSESNSTSTERTAVEEMSANQVSISNNAATMTNTVDSAETAVTAMQASMVKVTAERAGTIEGNCRELAGLASELEGAVSQYDH